ncbi:hypothetical protein ACFC58_06685 [Kitasatospora purpeofusca]|uniref:hypothetical protein n=1 Tax=Kitasatospora purpeofusca TaxID=67352 RepID=UPI0035D8302E
MNKPLPAQRVPRPDLIRTFAPASNHFARSGLISALRTGECVFALLGLGVSKATGLLDTLHFHAAAGTSDRLHIRLVVRAGRWGYRASCLDGTVAAELPGPDSVYKSVPYAVPLAGGTPPSVDQARTDHLQGLCCPAGTPIEGCLSVQDAVLAADPTALDQVEADLKHRFAALDAALARESEDPR